MALIKQSKFSGQWDFRMNLLWEKAKTRLAVTKLPTQGPSQRRAHPVKVEGWGLGQGGAEGGGREEEIQLGHLDVGAVKR